MPPNEKFVQLDLNNPEFLLAWVALESDEAERVRLTLSARGVGYRDGNFLRVLLVKADHDATYGKK
jgi:hypothetical protein